LFKEHFELGPPLGLAGTSSLGVLRPMKTELRIHLLTAVAYWDVVPFISVRNSKVLEENVSIFRNFTLKMVENDISETKRRHILEV
jgi:hypothetical protein